MDNSNITRISGTSVDELLENPNTDFHPERFLNIQHHLVILFHARRCMKERMADCKLPLCQTLKSIFNNVAQCPSWNECPVNYCTFSKKVLLHWMKCKQWNCRICGPLRKIPSQPCDYQQTLREEGLASDNNHHTLNSETDLPNSMTRVNQAQNRECTISTFASFGTTRDWELPLPTAPWETLYTPGTENMCENIGLCSNEQRKSVEVGRHSENLAMSNPESQSSSVQNNTLVRQDSHQETPSQISPTTTGSRTTQEVSPRRTTQRQSPAVNNTSSQNQNNASPRQQANAVARVPQPTSRLLTRRNSRGIWMRKSKQSWKSWKRCEGLWIPNHKF
ncbi:CREB-binding isoform X2 [Pelobates cultripes]|uniref:histone acetyltransferase n=1 Tax=Pelobates cultripes TaxID=61616 RepID=A0AAD1SQW2_PELCU|nr:CREB-binding isoform X2 [Pelobates cultripes]